MNEDTGSYDPNEEARGNTNVEFGFEFDILGGTRWPYSQPFCLIREDPNITCENVTIAPDEPVNTIRIDLGGTARYAKIWIYVNGRQIHYDDWMWSQDEPYNWET